MTHEQFIEAVLSNTLKLSYSSLMALRKSPRHFYNYKTKPKETTDAMVLGSYIHALLLQPEIADKNYAIKPDNANKASNANKAILAEFEANLGGRTPISEAMLNKALKVVKSIHEDDSIWPLFCSPNIQKEVRFDVEFLGVPLTGVRDIYDIEYGTTDLKTTANAEPKYFARKSMYEFLYHLQARIYTLENDISYTILAVDYDGFSSLLNFDNNAIEAGGMLLDKLVRNYKKLQEQTSINPQIWQTGYSFWYPDGYTISM